MKIHRDGVTASSILFTLALLIPTPAILANAWTVRQMYFDFPGGRSVENFYAPIGFASLAVILVGLIVTWLGYIKGSHWGWFVMFMITWGWAFPVLVLAEFHWRNMLPIAQWPALSAPGRTLQLGFTESLLTFLLMVLALIVPFRTNVLGRRRGPEGTPPARVGPLSMEESDTKIRRAVLAVSSILYTVALLMLTPTMVVIAQATMQSRFQDIFFYPTPGITPDQLVIPNHHAPLGITSLALIAIGLLVIWAGYIKGVRWTWFVMFVIVCIWALPVLVLPLLISWKGGVGAIPHFLAWAIHETFHAGPDITFAEGYLQFFLAFLLMVLGLALPIKTFLGRKPVARTP